MMVRPDLSLGFMKHMKLTILRRTLWINNGDEDDDGRREGIDKSKKLLSVSVILMTASIVEKKVAELRKRR